MKITLSPGRMDYLVREWMCDELDRINVENNNKWTRKEVEQAKNLIRRDGILTFVSSQEGTTVEMNVSISKRKRRTKKDV